MKIVSNLNFNGQCREAFERYAEVLGGKLTLVTFRDMPGSQVPEEWKDKIAHVWLQAGDQALMGCDVPPAYAEKSGGFSMTLHLKTDDETRRLFAALAEGGQVTVPLTPMSWSSCFGMLTDRFGTPWMLTTQAAQNAA
ncbi:VOC family protein [Melittangium boletus]|uniref:VOC family protein n=1 Tax=Melittangium boletus TaxID=83453 RepID=UPI003DA1F739